MSDRATASAADKRGWLPHPLLSASLVLVWLLLQNSLDLGNLLLGLVLGLGIPLWTRGLWPKRLRVRSWVAVLRYSVMVSGDIVLRTRWVSVPLELSSPEAITVLAGTVTMTPGTVSCDLSADGRYLLVHCLDAPDTEQIVREIKTRYEARLKEIFE